MPPIISHPTDDQLHSLLQGALPRSSAAELESHVETCTECAHRLESLPVDGQLTHLLRSLTSEISPVTADLTVDEGDTQVGLAATGADLDATPMPASVSRILTGAYQPGVNDSTEFVVSQPSAGTRLDAYEVLGELGEGGMGVVYKAKQKGLNRIVALKMVIGGGRVSSSQLARFYAEAQAVARLDHPNIVQIYDTGDDNGVPYFAMEYVDGGALDRKLRKLPMDPKEAAPLMETIARAIHYAHERGIVHRDLKPANILLTKSGEPKITDFGLAKQLDAESGQTHTGAIMGTPNYMPPEQADGHTRDVTPAADVYALGATFYDMLTGRPPFQGPTVVSIIQQVKSLEPVNPSRLQPTVPRDLETICLKCLQKDLTKRYGSAAEMADDLRRYIEGRPILARPVSVVEKGIRWCRRNPMIAGLTSVAALALIALVVTLSVGSWRIRQKNVALTTSIAQEQKSAQLAVRERNVAVRQSELNADQVRFLTRKLVAQLKSLGLQRYRQGLIDTVAGNLKRLEKLSSDTSMVTDRAQVSLAIQQAELFEEIAVADSDRAPAALDQATKLARQAVQLAEKIATDNPDADVARANHALAVSYLGSLLVRHARGDTLRIDEGASLLVHGLKVRQEIADAPRSGVDSREYIFPANALLSLAESHEQLAELAKMRNDTASATQHLDECQTTLERALKLVESDPKSTDDPLGVETFQLALARVYFRAAGAKASARKPTEAEALLNKALTLNESAVAANADSVPYKRELAALLFEVGKNRLINRNHVEARDAFDRMFLLMDEFGKQQDGDIALEAQWFKSLALYGVGVANLKLGDRRKALDAFKDCVVVRRRLTEDQDRPRNFWGLMVAQARAGNHTAAVTTLKKEQARQQEDGRKPFVHHFWFNAACTYSMAADAVSRLAPEEKLSPEMKQLRESYVAAAYEAVRQLFATKSNRTAELDSDPDLEYLQSLPAFKELLLQLRM